MFINPKIAESILKALKNAEEDSNPITLADALNRWGSGSTWEDLVDGFYIERYPKAVTLTKKGLEWLEENERKSKIMLECPGCSIKLSMNDLDSQISHMEKNHPEIINQRLKETKFQIP
ncbi:MAG: hypothetical protein ISR98_01990 [Parcubacteria group bacterium]|nr:hypothetical protein [Parcubacteria group bacterium]